jgi:DnaJ homolog subfamily C member 3
MISRLKRIAMLGAVLGLSFTTVCAAIDISPDTPISSLVASAKEARLRGANNDALAYFDAALAKDPSDYLTLFQRGATYLSIGKHSQAKADFDGVLRVKPNFDGALLQRAKLSARNGEWDAAKTDYKAAGSKGAEELAHLEEAEGAAYLAIQAEQNNDWESCINHAGIAILTAAGALSLRQLRARCRFEQGEVEMGVSDLAHVLQISPSSLEPYLQMSALQFYSLGQTEAALTSVKRCLQSDPESKPCKALFREEKTILKSLQNIDTLLSKSKYTAAAKELVDSPDAIGLLTTLKANMASHISANRIHPSSPSALYTTYLEKTCEAYMSMNSPKRATPYCTETLTLSPTSLHALLHLAQTQLDTENFEAAISTLTKAKEHHPSQSHMINEKLHSAQLSLKKSKQKDYYKVLSVERDASDRDIKTSYRKLTKEFHPDKAHSHGLSKEDAEKKMASINEAYEVLSDPELKQRYDNGDDPNDPMARSGGSPFEGQGFPFGGFPGGGQQQFFFQQGPQGGGGQRQFKFQAGGGAFGGFPFG